MIWPVAELKGCLLEDLLYAKTTVDDPSIRSSRQQLRSGGVSVLVPAAFAENWGSAGDIIRQSDIFRDLPRKYPDDFKVITTLADLNAGFTGQIGLIGAIENAGSLFSEGEFEKGIGYFEQALANMGRVLYVSLTWRRDTPLGGGDTTITGLRDLGRRFLDYLSDSNRKDPYKIAVDISHASDALAHDIFDYIDQKSLDLKVVASHSALRSVQGIPRNLPDWAVTEIIHRGGVVGINFISGFNGTEANDLLRNFRDMIEKFHGDAAVVFGADWYKDDRGDVPKLVPEQNVSFFTRYADASAYPVLLRDLREQYGFTDEQLRGIAYGNFHDFVVRQWTLSGSPRESG